MLALSESLKSALEAYDWQDRVRGIGMLEKLAKDRLLLILLPLYSVFLFTSFPANFPDAIKSATPKLVEMTVADDVEDVRNAGVQSLKALVQDGVLNAPLCFLSHFLSFPDQARANIKLAFRESLQPAFESDDWQHRVRAVALLLELAKDSLSLIYLA
jgi:hypothetical protein